MKLFQVNVGANHAVWRRIGAAATAATVLLAFAAPAAAHERYNDGCQNCHGVFTGPTSPKGTVFPSNDKHRMHRSSSYMGTNCDLCHRADDGRNPFLGSSTGTANNPGLGCLGCHGQDFGGTTGVTGAGLRKHHAMNGVTTCAGCHPNDPTPLPESVLPPYYGTVDTKCNDPCNAAPAHLENWSIGDTDGTDNDGDNMYDAADTDCQAACVPCDMNCDGSVNQFDINGFITVLSGAAGCSPCAGDANTDGTTNQFDINAFIQCLIP